MARARFRLSERTEFLSTSGLLEKEINPALAKFARAKLAEVITSGEGSSIYEKFVNGVEGAEEETVRAPGPIVYVFSYWEPIIKFALAYLERRSPVKTGRYRSSHRVMLGSQFIDPSTQISAGEEVTIVDTQPYSRKIEVGHMRMSVPDGVYEDAGREVSRQFSGAVRVRVKQILIPGGYILKGVFRKGYKPHARTKLQKDTQRGARMTYPALIMQMR